MQVVNCSSTVVAIGAQYTSLAAQAGRVLTFDIFLTSSQANQGLGCDVSLVNSQVRRSPHTHLVLVLIMICKECSASLDIDLVANSKLEFESSTAYWGSTCCEMADEPEASAAPLLNDKGLFLLTMQGVLIDVYGVAFAANATAFSPTVTQSDISSKACLCQI